MNPARRNRDSQARIAEMVEQGLTTKDMVQRLTLSAPVVWGQ